MICVLSLGKVVDEAQMGPLVPLVSFTASLRKFPSIFISRKTAEKGVRKTAIHDENFKA